MKFKQKFILLALLACFFTQGGFAAQSSSQKDTKHASKESHDFLISKNLDIFNSVYKELDLYYVDTLNPEKTIKGGIDNMLDMTDPYTTYFPESEMSDLKFMTTGAYAGVGAVISQKDKKVFITEIYQGMPAYKAGLRAGDVFVSVDGNSTDGKSTSDVSSMLRGVPQTTVKVVVSRLGVKENLKFDVVRENVVIDPIPYYGMLSGNVGYINITSFTDLSYSSFSKAFSSLKSKGMTSLVIDLRSNPGGLLSEAVKILNMFVSRGSMLVYTKGKEKKWDSEYRATDAPVDTNMPIVVLVNRNSASASEIVSGALQDLDRAVILGERTYGKGLVQTTRDIPYGGSLKVTIAKYYIPSGRCIQAIDYAKRDEDGLVKRIPDSLTHEFKTADGRIVRDGCGISPDVTMEDAKNAPITFYLYSKNTIFDYVTDFQSKHPSIGKLSDFQFNDYDGFKAYVKKSGFTYKTKSEDELTALKDLAKTEGYYERSKAAFDSLEKKLTPDLEIDLDSNKAEINKFISLEIARRYYYQSGVVEESLKTDKQAKAAVELLGDKARYAKLLAPSVSSSKPADKKGAKE